MVRSFHKTENLAGFIAVFLLALYPFMEVIARLFKTSIPYASTYTQHLVLVLTFLGGMITSREKKHLSLSLALNIEEPMKTRMHIGNMILSAMMTTAFFWSALAFTFTGFDPNKKIGIFPEWLVGVVMVIGFGMMARRFITAVPRKGRNRMITASGILLGTFIALEPIAKILATFYEDFPVFIESLLQFAQSANAIIALPFIILLIISAVFGAPLFVVLGGIAYLLFANAGTPLVVIPEQVYEMLKRDSIPAIPLFTVAGFLLSESKAGERLVQFFKTFFGWIPGGLAIMAILVCTFFTTFTGASGVTILALGALLSYVLINGKYKRKFSLGLLTASGSVGLLFPPSLPIIIYAVIAGVSVKDMFIGGIIPGFVMVLALVIFSIIYATKNKTQREPFKRKEAISGLKTSILEILLPIVIILCYFGGLTTLVESAAIAVIYAFIVVVIIHRDLKFKDLSGVIAKCIPIIGGVLIILALAYGLYYYIVEADVPMRLTEWVEANIASKYVFLLLLNIGLLITGCLMDIFSAIMVVVPLIIPLGSIFGIHPVHLGIIFLANMELGYMTPPVGLNLFLASYRFNEPMGKLYKDVLPFFFIQLAAVLLITYLPFLTTGLLSFLT